MKVFIMILFWVVAESGLAGTAGADDAAIPILDASARTILGSAESDKILRALVALRPSLRDWSERERSRFLVLAQMVVPPEGGLPARHPLRKWLENLSRELFRFAVAPSYCGGTPECVDFLEDTVDALVRALQRGEPARPAPSTVAERGGSERPLVRSKPGHR